MRFIKISTGPAHLENIDRCLFTLAGPYSDNYNERFSFEDFFTMNEALVDLQKRCLNTGELKCLAYKTLGTSGYTWIGNLSDKSIAYTIEWGKMPE